MLSPEELRRTLIVFTDGACSGNPGPGGWGAIVAFPEGRVKELGGQGQETTNNQMELMAAIKALAFIKNDPRPVYLYTDSVYVIRGITQWIHGWLRRGWKNAEGEPVANRESWQTLKALVDQRGKGKVSWKFCRGHSGVPGNERCDEIAVLMTQRKWVDLYDGPLVGYGVAIYDLPEDEPLPEMKGNGEPKPPAYSYLSYVDGVVRRHRDWSSCERYTKGRSGAKFRKAQTAADEAEILRAWGLGPGVPVEDV